MRQETLNIYKFEELDEDAQDMAILCWRESQHDYAIIEKIEQMEDEEVAEIIKKESQEFFREGTLYWRTFKGGLTMSDFIIATAPELLDDLKWILEFTELVEKIVKGKDEELIKSFNRLAHNVKKRAKQAIAKVEGADNIILDEEGNPVAKITK